jgi:hypothetical protein
MQAERGLLRPFNNDCGQRPIHLSGRRSGELGRFVASLAMIDRSVARIDLIEAGLTRHVLPHAKLTSQKISQE